jgi:microcystin-dependent protein
MAITLRTEKGTALTYAEMDKNFSSFFYSASVDYDTDLLQLWYTGSADLTTPGQNFNPGRLVSIPLNPSNNAITAVAVAGGPGEIQFRDYNNPILAASNRFIYTSTGNLGIGTPLPSSRIHVRGHKTIPATLRLESTPFESVESYISSIEFYEGTTRRGEIGRLSDSDSNIFINTAPGGNLRFKVQDNVNTGAWTTVGLGVGIVAPEKQLHVVGEGCITGGLGIGTYANNHAIYAFDNIGPATPLKSFKSFARFANFGGPTGGSVNGLNMITYRQEVGDNWISTGTRIQQLVDATYMGYIQYSGPDNLYGISIGPGNSKEDAFGAIHEPGHPDIGERLRITSAGRVGINTINPERILDVAGDTIVRGIFTSSLHVDVGLSLKIGTSAEVGTTLKVGSVPLNTDSNPRILVQSQTGNIGQVQYITNIVPKGAIMMWQSTTPPPGWRLCDGNNVGNDSGVNIPDLRERFIVGAGGDAQGVVSKNYATAQFDVQPGTFYSNTPQGAQFTLPLNSLANGEYNVVTTGVYHLTSFNNVVIGPVAGGIYGEKFFVYQKTGTNPYYLIYSTTVGNYILVRGTFTGTAGLIAGFGQATSVTTTTSGHYFTQFGTTVRGVADYSREINGNWIEGKRPDHVGFYYYDTLGYNIGDRGGINEVRLEVAQMPAHFHHTPGSVFKSFTAGAGDYGNNSSTGTGTDGANNSQTAIGNLGSNYDANGAALERTIGGYLPHENRPPYYALAFIIYIGE